MAFVHSFQRIAEERGKKQGKKQGKESVFLSLLKQKFGDLPDWVRTKVNTADEPVIHGWCLRILTKDNLEEVFAG